MWIAKTPVWTSRVAAIFKGVFGWNLLKIEDSGNALIYNGTKAVWSLKNPNGGGYESAVGFLLN
jgi:hypothetical protein